MIRTALAFLADQVSATASVIEVAAVYVWVARKSVQPAPQEPARADLSGSKMQQHRPPNTTNRWLLYLMAAVSVLRVVVYVLQ